MFLALTGGAGGLKTLKDKLKNVHLKQSVFQDELLVITGRR